MLAIAASGNRVFSACDKQLKCWQQAESTSLWTTSHEVAGTQFVSMTVFRLQVLLAGSKALVSFSVTDGSETARREFVEADLASAPLICANENGVFCLGDEHLYLFTCA